MVITTAKIFVAGSYRDNTNISWQYPSATQLVGMTQHYIFRGTNAVATKTRLW